MNDTTEYVINGLISAIKLVRCFTGLSLRNSKIVVERWAKAFGYASPINVCTNNPTEILALGKLAHAVASGECVITSDDKIMVNHPITDIEINPQFSSI